MDPLALDLLAAAFGLWLLAPVLASLDGPRTNRPAWSALIGLGACALLAAAVCGALAGPVAFSLPSPFGLASAGFAFRIDRLAAWFLAVIALVSAPAALYLPAYMGRVREHTDMRLFWAALAVLLLSMALVALAANVLTFLVAWELMSFSSFGLVATEHRSSGARHAALIYLGATRIGTAFLVAGFLWAHALTGNWDFTVWRLSGPEALGPGLLLLVGLGVKAGVWPFHLWLPTAHPAAPAPVSALMSGVMVKVAVYMMVRLFVLPAAFRHPAFGGVVLGLGAISAFWGVLFALLQHDLKRLLAYHTVENVGLILMGIGGAMVARGLSLGAIARLALAAALFHVLNHALFKSLLFLGTGAVDHAAGTRDLERLGGLGKRMPVTAACFLLGSAAICALPPLNGFASEWLLYQSGIGIAASAAPPAFRFCSLLLVGWLALIGALALACFVKASGVAFLGRPRSQAAEHAVEVSAGMRAAQIALALLCAALGLGPPAVLGALHSVVAPLQPAGEPLAAAWTLPSGALALTLFVTIGAGALWLAGAERKRPTRTYITWECGFGDLSPRMQATATSFAQPIARMFGALYRYAIHLHIDGANRRLFPEEITVEPRTEAMLESRVYHPMARWFGRAGDWVVRLQAGSIHLYLLMMFGTLLALLAVAGSVR